MRKILLILIAGTFVLSCKRDDSAGEEPDKEKLAFPFMNVGNQWNYTMLTAEGNTEVSYKIVDKSKEGYFKVLLGFVGSEFPPVEHYWHADQKHFAMSTDWPESTEKFTLLKRDCKVGDHWQYFIPAPLDPKSDDLWGEITYKVLEANSKVSAMGQVFNDVYKIRHTASSYPQYFADYYISLSSAMIKLEGMGYVRIEDDEGDRVEYFPLEWRLKSKNF